MHGRWTLTVRDYVREVSRYREEVGGLVWAACCDWMCEPHILAQTGKPVAEHQRLTLEAYQEAMAEDPGVPIIPVLQGWSLPDYLRHIELYATAGIDLAALPRVGVGSVCRRQGTTGAAVILRMVAARGIRSHAFGLKLGGLLRSAADVVSADSLAWSFGARRCPPLRECVGIHADCNNCIRYALRWRGRLLKAVDIDPPDGAGLPVQPRLFPGSVAA